MNNKEEINLDLIEEGRKRIYKKVLGRKKDVKRDLNNNIINKSIYSLFSNNYIY